MTTITAQDIRNARLNGQDALKALIDTLPSIETATPDEVTAFIESMERIPA